MTKSASSKLADSIFRDLQAQILGGRVAPSERLPSERELAARYHTNRNTLREAVRRLEQSGLVTVRHGQGVTVADYRRTGTLDVLGPFLESASDAAERMRAFRDLLSARTVVLEMAVAMAAQRSTPADTERIARLVAKQREAFACPDRAALMGGDLELIDALVDAAHSLPVRWTANTLLGAVRSFIERAPSIWVFMPSYLDYLDQLVAALDAGDGAAAGRATEAYYRQVDEKLVPLLDAAARAADQAAERAAAPGGMDVR